MDIEMMNSKFSKIVDMGIEYAPKLLMALAVLFLGLWVINKMVDWVGKQLDRSKISRDIQPFMKTMIGVILKVMLVFSVAGMVGIETTSFVAVMAAAGFAIGMAMQGTLSNFAAGIMIIIFKPYKVDDLVTIQGEHGHVQEIQIFNTIIKTLDNKTVIIPNSLAIGGIIVNISTDNKIRVDLSLHMPYAESFDKVEEIILEAVKQTPKVLNEPAPVVGIDEFDSHNVKLAVWPYALTEDYWEVKFAANRNIKDALAKAGIKVAYSEGVELGDIG